MRAAAHLGVLVALAGCSFDASGVGPGAGGEDGDAADASNPTPPPDAAAADGAPDPSDAAAADAALADAPPNRPPVPVHLYPFDGTADDVEGGAHGDLSGDVEITDGRAVFGRDDEVDDPGWIELPADEIAISSFDAVTFEAWFTYDDRDDDEDAHWQRVYAFGARGDWDGDEAGADNTFFTPTSGEEDSRAAIARGNPGLFNEVSATTSSPLPAQEEHYIAVTLNAEEIALFVDGSLEAVEPYDAEQGNPPPSIDQLSDEFAFLGRSLYEADAAFQGSIRQFAIFDVALSPDEIADRYGDGPP